MHGALSLCHTHILSFYVSRIVVFRKLSRVDEKPHTVAQKADWYPSQLTCSTFTFHVAFRFGIPELVFLTEPCFFCPIFVRHVFRNPHMHVFLKSCTIFERLYWFLVWHICLHLLKGTRSIDYLLSDCVLSGQAQTVMLYLHNVGVWLRHPDSFQWNHGAPRWITNSWTSALRYSHFWTQVMRCYIQYVLLRFHITWRSVWWLRAYVHIPVVFSIPKKYIISCSVRFFFFFSASRI